MTRPTAQGGRTKERTCGLGKAENHKDDEHDDVQAARQREEVALRLRARRAPRDPAADSPAREFHRPVLSSCSISVPISSKADGEWTRVGKILIPNTTTSAVVMADLDPAGFPGTPRQATTTFQKKEVTKTRPAKRPSSHARPAWKSASRPANNGDRQKVVHAGNCRVQEHTEGNTDDRR